MDRPLDDMLRASLLELFDGEGRGATGSERVFYGGPVRAGRAFVLHTTDRTSAEGRVIGGGIAPTAQPATLENEIRRGSWISVPADEPLVFEDDADVEWEHAMARRRISI